MKGQQTVKQIVISGDDIEHVFDFVKRQLDAANIYTNMRLANLNALVDALDWALDQLEDSLDPGHQAALAAALRTLNEAKGTE